MNLSPDLRRTPPSSDALRHSGGDRRLWTSATVTLYLDVELNKERRPGTEQNTSVGFDTMPISDSFWKGRPSEFPLGSVTGPGEKGKKLHLIQKKKRENNCGWATVIACICPFPVYVHKL